MADDYDFRLEARVEGVWIEVRGDLSPDGAGRLLAAVEAGEPGGARADLALGEADLPEGKAVALMVDLVRLLLGRFERVRLLEAPQSLAHTLYRTGMLRGGGRLELIAPREEEGSPG
ncbi:MAG: hypothetical protein V3V62_04355 [bacterium]